MTFKFCPKCGSDKLRQKSDNLLICPDCQFEWYQNPKPAANFVFIDEQERIMLGKRKFEPKSGFWGTPGGFVDLDETLEEAAIREAEEELDLKIESNRLRYICSKKDRYFYSGCNYYTVGALYEVKLDQSEVSKITPSDDVSEIFFFEFKDIPWADLAFDSTRDSLKLYFSSQGLGTKSLESLRNLIDKLDKDILYDLNKRQKIVRLIGRFKIENNLPIKDSNRWEKVKTKLKLESEKIGLDWIFVIDIWEKIHQYSLQIEKDN